MVDTLERFISGVVRLYAAIFTAASIYAIIGAVFTLFCNIVWRVCIYAWDRYFEWKRKR